MGAAWPTTRTALTVFELFLRAPDSSLSRDVLLRIVHPADELIAGQGRDVLPRIQCRSVDQQRTSQVGRKFVYHAAWYSLNAHGTRLTVAPL
jgi:hypothetical protein